MKNGGKRAFADMRKDTICDIWREAQNIDPTLKVAWPQWSPLLRRRLKPELFSRQLLFSRMADGQPLLAQGLPVPVQDEGRLGTGRAVLVAIAKGFRSNERVRVRCGASASTRILRISEVLRRWSNERTKVSVTDLHIRSTSVMHRINCSALSDFNLLPTASKEVAQEEILTLVISSAGTFTDSHTDDPDGSNHCFVGRKLWLVWDTFLGMKHGLEDIERNTVTGTQAAFGIKDFLSIRGSRWFLVEPGQTLFLPGNMAHKVITLEAYLGVGSFFVMLPSYLRTLERWTLHTALWALDLPRARQMEKVNQITQHVLANVRYLARASSQERVYWGLDHLERAARLWAKRRERGLKQKLIANSAARHLLSTLLGSSRRL